MLWRGCRCDGGRVWVPHGKSTCLSLSPKSRARGREGERRSRSGCHRGRRGRRHHRAEAPAWIRPWGNSVPSDRARARRPWPQPLPPVRSPPAQTGLLACCKNQY